MPGLRESLAGVKTNSYLNHNPNQQYNEVNNKFLRINRRNLPLNYGL